MSLSERESVLAPLGVCVCVCLYTYVHMSACRCTFACFCTVRPLVDTLKLLHESVCLPIGPIHSGVAIECSAGSRNRGTRPLWAPDRESSETSNEHKS